MKREFFLKPRNVSRIILLIFLFVTSCGLKNEISKQDAAEIYVHLQIIKEQYRDSTELIKSHSKKLFEKYKITKHDYQDFIAGFKESEKEWNEFFDLAEKYLNELKKKKSLSN